MRSSTAIAVLAVLAAAASAWAQVPSTVSYQGRLSAGGSNGFDGPGLFKFALVSAGTNVNRQAKASATVSGGFVTMYTILDGGAGYVEVPAVTITDVTGSNALARATIVGGTVTAIEVLSPGRDYSASPTVVIEPSPPAYVYGTFWSNDGTSSAGSEPASALPLRVNQGVFSVNLGDTVLPNMTAAIPQSVFTNADVRLRIWFNDGVAGFQQFHPDQRFTSVPYAALASGAGGVVDASITSADVVVASVGSELLGPGAVGVHALAESAVTSVELLDSAVTADKLAPGAVTASKLAANTVDRAKLQDSAVTGAKLAAGAVETTALADNAATAARLSDGAVVTAKLAAGAVDASRLTDGAVSIAKLQDGAVTAGKLPPELRQPPTMGAILAWASSLPGTPALPPGWVECNGQVLNDASSPYHGTAIPNLNGSGGDAQRFTRGSTTSGAIGGEDTHTLTVAEMPSHTHSGVITIAGDSNLPKLGNDGRRLTTGPSEATGGNQSHENRPPFYEIVWIMRVR